MSSKPTKNLQVAIVGGGVCGLTCAIALRRRGVPVQVYEAAASFGEIGAGLGIGCNVLGILRDLGVMEDVLQRSEEPERTSSGWFYFLSGMDGHELIYDYTTPPTEGSIGIHRALFLDALVEHIDPDSAHFDKRCIGVVPSDRDPSKLSIKFADGTDALADVVLGADGVKSAVRGAVTGKALKETLSFSNTMCYRGLIPTEIAREAGVTRDYRTRPVCYVGKDRHLVIFAIRGGTLINVAAFVAKYDVAIGDRELPPEALGVEVLTNEQLLKDFEGWGSEVTGLLSCIEEPNRWSINVVHPPLQSYAKGKIALLGDAAHGMLPHLGAGAGQGIEDADVLAKLLSHPETTVENVDAVLQAYDEVRRPRAQRVWESSVQAGRIFDGHGPSGGTPDGMRQDLAGMWNFVWRHNLDEDVQQAIHGLQKRGVFAPLPHL